MVSPCSSSVKTLQYMQMLYLLRVQKDWRGVIECSMSESDVATHVTDETATNILKRLFVLQPLRL